MMAVIEQVTQQGESTMAVTQQQQAILVANQVCDLMAGLASILHQADIIVSNQSHNNYTAVWNNLPTAPENPDGSFGAADSQPNVSHPITEAGLDRAVSANELGQGIAVLEQIQLLFRNGVTSQSEWETILAQLTA